MRRIAAAALLLVGAFLVLYSLRAAFASVPSIPYLDGLSNQNWFFHVERQAQGMPFWLRLTPSNEHLMLFPMPLYWLDNVLFQARGMFLVGVIHLVNAMVALVLVAAARRRLQWPASTTAAAAALLAATWFWGGHGENLFWPMQVHMYCMLGAVVLGARCAAEHERAGGAKWLLAALACFSVGIWSFGYGLAGWAALLLYAVCHWPWRQWLAVLLLGALHAVLYRSLMVVGGTAPDIAGLDALPRIGEYVLHFLSGPTLHLLRQVLSDAVAGPAALGVGALGIVSGIWFAARHLWRRTQPDGLMTLAVLLMLFGLASAGLTALARMGVGIEGARQARYLMIPIAFWNGWLLALWHAVPVRWRSGAVLLSALVLLPPMLASHLQQWRLNRLGRSYLVGAEMAVLHGVQADDATLLVLHPGYRTLLPRVAEELRARQWAIFAGPQDEWIGRRLEEVFTVAPGRSSLSGSVQARETLPEQPEWRRIQGWAFDTAAGAPPEWLAFAGADGTIVGLGHSRALPPSGADPLRQAEGFWVGYARVAPDGAEPAVYALVDDRTAVPLPGR